MAGTEHGPVIIAGDTNLATLSRVFAENLSTYTDGFVQAGAGFGYTFPANHAWMRIDRILTTKDLGVGNFRVSCRDCSDHLCVVADVGRAR
jgi:endonuclease/exonuclease/phosphatase family metal-dependent hydrolase